MTDKKNYYEILQIDKNATPEEIKKSYKKLALLYHPDKNNNDPVFEEKFKEVNEAYSVLSNSDKKAQYDVMGEVDESFGGEDPFSVFNNIFQQHMGNFMNMRYDEDINLNNVFGNVSNMQNGSFPFGNIHVRVHTFPTDIFEHNSRIKEENNFEEIPSFEEMPNIKNIFQNLFNGRKNINKEKPVKVINGKPDPIIYNINVSFSDIYNMKKKKIVITRRRKRNGNYIDKKKKIEIPIYGKEIVLDNEGDELKNYKERGDVIINIFNNKEDNFKRINDYDVLTYKDILINNFYSVLTYDLILPNGEVLKVQSEKMNKELIQKIPNKGLPYENETSDAKYGDLYIIYKVIFPETIEELKDIIIKDNNENINDYNIIAYNSQFNELFNND